MNTHKRFKLMITVTLAVLGLTFACLTANHSATVQAAPLPSIAGSTVTPDHSTYVTGTSNTYTITVYNASPDWEWLDAVTVTFPGGWTVTAVQTDTLDSCRNLVDFSTSGVGTNQVNFADSNGGGGEIWNGCSWNAVFTVTVPGSTAGTQVVNWALSGDDGGSDPHDIIGSFVLTAGASDPEISVAITGPATGITNTAYTFTATISPPTATLPITYVWQATDRSVITHTDGGLTDTSGFIWPTTGAKSITVTAANADHMNTATRLITVVASGTLFTDIGAALTEVYFSSVAWGDYDNDGDLDILLTGCTGEYCTRIAKIYRNDGSGVFTDIGAALTGVSSGSVAWGDYDNDGDLDILLTGMNNSICEFFRVPIATAIDL